jgi:NAD(P)-dependent dehydrogenase (short-subunit alcohol dehydrogenase family)
MDLELGGRVCLVTGSTSGIGLATARQLSAEGARVAICGRDSDRVERARRYAGAGFGVIADLGEPGAPEELVSQTQEALGPIDVLVNNAGIVNNIAPIAQMARDAWDREMAVNLGGAFACIQATVPGMAARGWGRVVNISSVAALQPSTLQPAYGASKAGLIALTKTVAKEYGDRGVTCNAVLPGLIATPLALSMPEELRSGFIKQVPSRRLGEPAEIATVVAFLASPAASYVNGAEIPVDGGWLAGPPALGSK